jgi:dTDP-4-amino-4,6-dideoxygalactose transaminase
MYVPGWPGLNLGSLLRPDARELPFPFCAAEGSYFYRARTAIYHLFRALRLRSDETVLVPDYHSGNEVLAIRAAGAGVCYYPIRRNLQPDLEVLERSARASNARVLFAIHFLGWPQPIEALRAFCRERGMILVEDCALSLLSETHGRPLGTFGDYAVFCLYKTVPIPNGGLLVQNGDVLDGLGRRDLQPCGLPSVAGRTLELFLETVRGRWDRLGAALFSVKRSVGAALRGLHVRPLPVGDIGFQAADLEVDMSSVCRPLLRKFDYEGIRRRRRDNFLLLREKLAGRVSVLCEELPPGVCPLFFPILVADKHAAARSLWDRGVSAVEFWNHGDPEASTAASGDAQFLREHVLELPIHQGVTPSQVEYMADQVLRLSL